MRVNGSTWWASEPAYTYRSQGGRVVFTTLGPRAWFRPRTQNDPPSPFENFPSLPVPGLFVQRSGEIECRMVLGGIPFPATLVLDGGPRLPGG